MRLATMQRDEWELRSAEASHRENPDTFWIPPAEQRRSLAVGRAARLIFEIRLEDDGHGPLIQGERMWVNVSEIVGSLYVGLLDNQPTSCDPGDEGYLCFGAEVPFAPQHIVDIGDPPPEYVRWQLGQGPERCWPRE